MKIFIFVQQKRELIEKKPRNSSPTWRSFCCQSSFVKFWARCGGSLILTEICNYGYNEVQNCIDKLESKLMVHCSDGILDENSCRVAAYSPKPNSPRVKLFWTNLRWWALSSRGTRGTVILPVSTACTLSSQPSRTFGAWLSMPLWFFRMQRPILRKKHCSQLFSVLNAWRTFVAPSVWRRLRKSTTR